MVTVGALWPNHAILMILGLALLTTGMLVARYRKARKNWLPLHKALGLVGATFALLGLMTATYMVAASSGRHFAAVPHTYLGALALLFFGMTPLLGYAQVSCHGQSLDATRDPSLVWSDYLTPDRPHDALRPLARGAALSPAAHRTASPELATRDASALQQLVTEKPK